MARTTKPLTPTQVEKAKPKPREFNLVDQDGLYLRVRPTGVKSWLFQYPRPYTKKRTNISIGKYPAFTLADARKKAREYKALLAENIDPKQYRESEAKSALRAQLDTLEAISERWLATKDFSDAYEAKVRQGLKNHVYPTLGKLPLKEINATETIEMLSGTAERGHFETIRKVCRWLNEIMDFGANTGVVSSNPLSGIRKAFKNPQSTNMPTLKPEELPALVKVIKYGRILPVTRLLANWQLHTMTRPSEAAGTRWSEIDFKALVWTIPESRMKSRKAHKVPLTEQMVAILEEARLFSGNRVHIFPSHTNPTKPASSQTVNMALKRNGLKGKIVSHGFRALASTTLNEKGFDPDIIEAALAHVDPNKIRGAYNRATYLKKRIKMMQWWSAQIDAQD